MPSAPQPKRKSSRRIKTSVKSSASSRRRTDGRHKGHSAKVIPLGSHIYRIHRENLFDLLSEVLVLEKNSIRLYSLARDRARVPDLRAKSEELLEESEHHLDALQTAVRDLGGNPVYVSRGAEILEQRAHSIFELRVPTYDQTLADIENILINESLEYVYWTFLKTIVPHLEDPHARDAVEALVEGADQKEFEHVVWAQETMTRLLLQRALQPTEPPETEEDIA